MSNIATRVDLDGHRDLGEALREMPLRVAKVGLRKAVNAGANPLMRAYRINLSDRTAKARDENATGLMKKAVRKKVRFYENGGTYVAIVGVDRSVTGTRGGRQYIPSNVAHLKETGAKAHIVIPKTGPWKGRRLKNPGFPATHPLKRAVESTAGVVIATMTAKLKESIEEAAAKFRK